MAPNTTATPVTTPSSNPALVEWGPQGNKTVRTVDPTLIDRLVCADETALAEIYDQYADLVFGLALRVVKDRSVAEDVTQETFVYLWQRPEAFNAGLGSLKTFLCMIAHRRAVDAVRKSETFRKRQAVIDLVAEDHSLDRIARLEELGEIKAAIRGLPPGHAEAIQLAYFDGLTYRQVAQILDIPEGTAKSRIRRALEQLNRSLTAEAVRI